MGERPHPDPGARRTPSPGELEALSRAIGRARQQMAREGQGKEAVEHQPRPSGAAARWRPRWQPPARGRRTAAAAALLLVVAGALAGLGLAAGPGRQAAGRAERRSHTRASPPLPTTTVPARTGSSLAAPPPTTAPTTTSSTALPSSTSAPGPAPVLVALAPPDAAPGRVIVLRGRNFWSRDGLIVAYVDGRPARTRCPTETTCDVTVPPLGHTAAEVMVKLETSGGQSNPLPLGYF